MGDTVFPQVGAGGIRGSRPYPPADGIRVRRCWYAGSAAAEVGDCHRPGPASGSTLTARNGHQRGHGFGSSIPAGASQGVISGFIGQIRVIRLCPLCGPQRARRPRVGERGCWSIDRYQCGQVRVISDAAVCADRGEHRRVGAMSRSSVDDIPNRLPRTSSGGTSRHGAPVRKRQAIASDIAR